MKSKHVINRLRKCAQVDRYIIRHYHKGPVAAREYTRRKCPELFILAQPWQVSKEQISDYEHQESDLFFSNLQTSIINE